VNKDKQEYMLYYEYHSEAQPITKKAMSTKPVVKYFLALTDVPLEYIESLYVKQILVVISGYDHTTATMELAVYVKQSALKMLNFPAEAGKMCKLDRALSNLISYFYDIEIKGRISI
jgi:hypothetical protein